MSNELLGKEEGVSALKYCFDTSSFIEPWTRRLVPDVFEKFWIKLAEIIDGGKLIISPDPVKDEIKKIEDDLYGWISSRSNFFAQLDEPIQIKTREVLESHPTLVKQLKKRQSADAFVIGLAAEKKLTVVTEESPGSNNKAKIPDVCKKNGVKCINMTTFLREQGWKF